MNGAEYLIALHVFNGVCVKFLQLQKETRSDKEKLEPLQNVSSSRERSGRVLLVLRRKPIRAVRWAVTDWLYACVSLRREENNT